VKLSKAEKKKRKLQKMKRLTQSIPLNENSKYKKFKDGCQLTLNCSTTKYFVVRYCAKQLFGYRLSHYGISENHEVKL
jgi:hypothetical protein